MICGGWWIINSYYAFGRNLHNYYCQAHSSIMHRVTVWAFGLSSTDAGIMVHASAAALSYIVPANYELFVAANRKIEFSIHLDSSPAIQCEQIPIWAVCCIHQEKRPINVSSFLLRNSGSKLTRHRISADLWVLAILRADLLERKQVDSYLDLVYIANQK